MLKQLVKVANRLDSLGLTKEADALDREIVKLASDGDFSLGDFDSEEEGEDEGEIIGRYSPTSFPDPEVVRIKTSPSSVSPYESAASASPGPLPANPYQSMEPSALSLLNPEKPSKPPAKGLRESYDSSGNIISSTRRTSVPPAKELTEDEQNEKNRIIKLISDAKNGDQEALTNVLVELDNLEDPVLKGDSPEGVVLNQRGWKLDAKALEELKGLLEEVTKIKESDSKEQANKKRIIRAKLLKALGSVGRYYDIEPQFVEGKFYLVKRLAGKMAPWSYVAEYDSQSSALIAEDQIEEKDSEHEYAVYDANTAKKKLEKKTLSPTPSYMDPYFGMTQSEVFEERRRMSEEERSMRIKDMEQSWKQEMERLQEEEGVEAWQIPNMPDFAGVVPRVEMPEQSKAVRDRAWESQNIEETDSEEEDKPKKSNDDLSPEWMQQQAAKLQENQKARINESNMRERLRTQDEDMRKRLKKIREGGP